MDSIFPTLGTMSPRVTFRMPFGPSKTGTVQPSMVVGLVSGTAEGRVDSFPRPMAVGAKETVFCFFGKETAFVN